MVVAFGVPAESFTPTEGDNTPKGDNMSDQSPHEAGVGTDAPASAQTVPGQLVSSGPQEPAPPREWNPLAKREPVRRPLKASDVGNGPTATVLYARWGGRERLAYEDALTERAMTKDQRAEETVLLGTLRLFAVSLTVIGAEGFPSRSDGTPMFTGGRELIEADLLSFGDGETYDEIRDAALEIQPLPQLGGGAEAKSKGADDGDPSPKP